MPDVTEMVRINLDAETLWEKVGSFGAVGDWHPMLANVASDGDQPGALRHVEAKDGSKQVERLEEIDPDRHVYRYSMQETAMPVDHYAAELRIDEDGVDASTVTWAARFDVTSGDEPKVVGMIRQFLRTGLDNLKHAHG